MGVNEGRTHTGVFVYTQNIQFTLTWVMIMTMIYPMMLPETKLTWVVVIRRVKLIVAMALRYNITTAFIFFFYVQNK